MEQFIKHIFIGVLNGKVITILNLTSYKSVQVKMENDVMEIVQHEFHVHSCHVYNDAQESTVAVSN